jgi:hypothetical protein
MFAGAVLDAGTTWVFVSKHYGFEQNPILAPLVRGSLIWIPIYLLCHPLLVPLVPEICGLGFAVYFSLVGLTFGANNLAGIFYGRFFLVEVVGYEALHAACALVAINVFIWTLWRRVSDSQERKRYIITALCWIGIFVLLELGLFAAGRLFFS